MADRTTKVTLTAQVSGYIAGMEKAAKATRATGSEAEKLAQKKESIATLGKSLLAIGAVAAAGVGLAVAKFAEFDAKMSQVKTLSHATAGEMDELTAAALNMGQAIGFSATEVADAEIELVKAGVAVKDIMGGALKGALELAAAGQIDVAEATSIASAAMVQFGLKGKDVPHIADLLAAGADKALGGVSDLGQALKYAGPVAASFGVSLDETVGVLSEFAQNGILADQAGTGLRGVLSSLTSPSAIAADVMKKYGITLFDASGKFIGLAGAAGQLHDKLGGLTDQERSFALGQIFGNQQITTANILMKGGAQEVQKWTDAVNDQGFASEQARGKMDNLAGDVKKLGAAFQSGLIEAGSQANGALRGIVQTVTNLVSAFSDLSGPAQATILAVGAVVAVVGLLGGGILTLVPKLAAFKNALSDIGTSMRTIGIAGGAVALAITGLVTVLSLMAGSQADAKQTAQDLADTLDKETGAITKNTRAYAADKLQKDGTIKAAKALGLSAKEVVDAYLQQPAALAKAQKALKDLKDPTSALGKESRSSGDALAKMSDGALYLEKALGDGSGATKDAKERLKELREATDDSADGTDAAAGSIDALAGATDKATQSTDDFNKALAGLGQVNLDASSATIKYQQAIASASDAVKENGANLDLSTDAGRKNQSALDDLASSAVALIAAQQAAGTETSVLTANMGAARDAFINAAVAAGRSTEEANKLADQYGLIPADVSTAYHTTGADAAILAARELKNAQDAIERNIQIRVNTINTNAANPNVGFGLGDGHADGGLIRGPGTSRSDSILTPTSNGEFVVNARATAQNLALLSRINSGGDPYSTPAYSPAPAAVASVASADAPSFNVVLSSKGGVDLLKYVDVQIEKSDAAKARKFRQG